MITVDGKLMKRMKEAAESFQISEKTLRNWLKSGKILPLPDTRQGASVLS